MNKSINTEKERLIIKLTSLNIDRADFSWIVLYGRFNTPPKKKKFYKQYSLSSNTNWADLFLGCNIKCYYPKNKVL